MLRKVFCIALMLGIASIMAAKVLTVNKGDFKTPKAEILSHSPKVNSNLQHVSHIAKTYGTDQSEDTLHWDSGQTYTGIGLTSGGTYIAAARFTPTMSCSLKAVVFLHFSQTSHSGNIRVYGPGTNVTPGPEVASTAYTAPDSNWLRVDFASPVFLSGGVDFWTGVEITHAAGEYPIGADFGPMVQDRGGFVTMDGGATWIQLNSAGLDYNWNIWAIVEFVHLDHDVAATSILAPSGAVPQGSVITPRVIVHNFGSSSETFPVTMEIGTIYTQTINNVDLDPDETDTIAFPDWTATPGAYTTKAYTALVGDMNLMNDTIRGSVAVAQYIEDFEANDGNYIPDPMTGAWEWGVPNSGPYAAHSGVNVWGTVLNGQYINSANYKLNSCEFAATADNPELRFWHWYDMESYYDGGNVKISTDGGMNWTIVTPQSGYPEPAASSSNAGIPNEPCYSGTSAGWEEAVFTLPVSNGQIFMLRWHFGSDPSVLYDGWYIDDVSGAGFNIVSIDHDVGATAIVAPSGSVQQGTPVTPKVVIRNFGSNNENFPVTLRIGSGYSQTLSNVPLNAGQIDTVEFPTWTATTGLHLTTAYTALVGDMRPANDTAHGSVAVLEYVEDFEASNGGYTPDPASGAWEWGTPSYGPGSAHSGVNVWATALSVGEYASSANWKLDSRPYYATADNPELRFWHWYDMESNYDGGNLKISTDGGSSWSIVTPQSGYPGVASSDNAGIPNEPCYNGSSGSWLEAIFTLPVSHGQSFLLRWHFGSDPSVTYAGWYIDDVGGAGFGVGIAENNNADCLRQCQDVLQAPNPITRNGAKISFGVAKAGNISLSVFDASGRSVKTLVKGNFEPGKYNIVWNTKDNDGRNATGGVYFLVLRNGESKLTKKLIVNE
jgi:hypothetical protein